MHRCAMCMQEYFWFQPPSAACWPLDINPINQAIALQSLVLDEGRQDACFLCSHMPFGAGGRKWPALIMLQYERVALLQLGTLRAWHIARTCLKRQRFSDDQ